MQVIDIDGKIIDKISLNFPGNYNADGFPDFTIGTYGSSSMNIFELYSIDKDGRVICIGNFTDVSKKFSIYLEQEEGSTDFTATIWNNVMGEAEVVCWKWNAKEGRYVE